MEIQDLFDLDRFFRHFLPLQFLSVSDEFKFEMRFWSFDSKTDIFRFNRNYFNRLMKGLRARILGSSIENEDPAVTAMFDGTG